MRYNLIYLPIKEEPNNKPDELALVKEIRGLISKYQDQNLSITTRKETFKKIIVLTDQLID